MKTTVALSQLFCSPNKRRRLFLGWILKKLRQERSSSLSDLEPNDMASNVGSFIHMSGPHSCIKQVGRGLILPTKRICAGS